MSLYWYSVLPPPLPSWPPRKRRTQQCAWKTGITSLSQLFMLTIIDYGFSAIIILIAVMMTITVIFITIFKITILVLMRLKFPFLLKCLSANELTIKLARPETRQRNFTKNPLLRGVSLMRSRWRNLKTRPIKPPMMHRSPKTSIKTVWETSAITTPSTQKICVISSRNAKRLKRSVKSFSRAR